MVLYYWIKTLHILAIISWMAGLLYLPRLFVYHANVAAGSETSELFKIMERRLLKAIMTPAMIVAWICGLWLAYEISAFSQTWFSLKMVVVLIMSGVHGLLARHVRMFAEDRNIRNHHYFRIVNEIPTLLMIFAVGLVIFKP